MNPHPAQILQHPAQRQCQGMILRAHGHKKSGHCTCDSPNSLARARASRQKPAGQGAIYNISQKRSTRRGTA